MKFGNMKKLVLICVAFVTTSLIGAGITIYPGGTLTFVRAFDTDVRLPSLFVVNVNESPMDYELKVVSSKLLSGYFPVPDVEWVILGSTELTIDPYDTVEIPIMINVPDDSVNFNRAWSFDVQVTQTPVKRERAGFAMLQLGAKSTWLLETKSVSDYIPKPSDEPMAVSPGIWFVDFEGEEETKGEIPIEFRNDSDVEHTYYFEVYNTPDYGDSIRGQKLDIIPMFAYADNWITDKSWVYPKPGRFLFFKKQAKVTLAPGESGTHHIVVDIPEEALGENVYETVVFIKPENNVKLGRFIRFVIK